ncbi:hypothetical protein [Asticcacaulis tiandongensis]|uniref:hypothetical protein n=1 Tax=Asticcacaulis tiandongensis TaxID=2565365 RepID=UPI001128028B|nr:hypothetical protein [Asticcacaulis tiandongensis]
MLPESSLNEAALRPALVTHAVASPASLSPDLEAGLHTGIALRLNLFRPKKHISDQHSPRRSDKYPFKWTVLGLLIVCSAFWMAIGWLIFS